MKPSDVLRKAAELIADPERWTQNTSAKNSDGFIVNATDIYACKWCAGGAILKVVGMDNDALWNETYINFGKTFRQDLSAINDYEGHAYTIGAMMYVADIMDGL